MYTNIAETFLSSSVTLRGMDQETRPQPLTALKRLIPPRPGQTRSDQVRPGRAGHVVETARGTSYFAVKSGSQVQLSTTYSVRSTPWLVQIKLYIFSSSSRKHYMYFCVPQCTLTVPWVFDIFRLSCRVIKCCLMSQDSLRSNVQYTEHVGSTLEGLCTIDTS